ncbi:MAG: TonB-dependent receptor [Desulfuromonadaceae bacterium]|nr:TonB-dependent receptor [Desulfuromonadaceae bacterium]
MPQKIPAILLLGIAAIASPLFAAEESYLLNPIIVTATRTATPSLEIAASCTVITAEEIEARQHKTVLDVLRGMPGLDITRAGSMGQQGSVLIRGGNSEHTLVLIDGVEANDPSTPGRSFDFAHLTTDNIERIEILRGPQSVLYGSDAMAGVIHIITRQGRGKPTFWGSVEGGSFRTFREALGGSGGNEKLNYSLSLSRIDSDGISAAGSADGNKERDGYRNTTLSLKLGAIPTKNTVLDLTARYMDSKTEIDNFGGPLGDDPNNELQWQTFHLRGQGTLRLLEDLWESKIAFNFTDNQRDNDNGPDAEHPVSLLRSSFDSRLYKGEWQNDLHLGERHTLTLGAEYQQESAKSRYYEEYADYFTGLPVSSTSDFRKKTAYTMGVFLQEQFRYGESFFATAGIRLDDHESFDSQATWRITSAYILPRLQTKLSATLGTAFKAPSLYQLHVVTDYVLGNENLDPEESLGWEVGIEQPLLDRRLTLSATYFRNDFDNLITTEMDAATWQYRYVNVDKARTRGFELEALFQPLPELGFSAAYTQTDAENRDTGEDLPRRPRHKFSINCHYRFLDHAGADLTLVYVGKRDDLFYNEATYQSGRVELDDYTLVNLAAHWDVTPKVRLFGRIDNLFDEDYEEIWGYGTPGIGAFAGIRLRL